MAGSRHAAAGAAAGSVPRGMELAGLARAERLVVAGGVAAIVIPLLNLAVDGAVNGGTAPIVIVAAMVAVGAVFTAGAPYASNWPLPAPAVARTAANVALLLTALDALELSADLGAIEMPRDILPAAAPVAMLLAAAVLAVGAHRLGPAAARPDLATLSRAEYLILGGGGLIVLGWVLMVTIGDVFEVAFGPAVGITAAVLAMSAVAISHDPAVTGRGIPWDLMATGLAIGALVAWIVHLGGFLRALRESALGGPAIFGTYLVWVVGLALLAVGAAVWVRRTRLTRPPA